MLPECFLPSKLPGGLERGKFPSTTHALSACLDGSASLPRLHAAYDCLGCRSGEEDVGMSGTACSASRPPLPQLPQFLCWHNHSLIFANS